jgi:hypothetical protein
VGSTLAGRNSLATRTAIPNDSAAIGAHEAAGLASTAAVTVEARAEHSVVTAPPWLGRPALV